MFSLYSSDGTNVYGSRGGPEFDGIGSVSELIVIGLKSTSYGGTSYSLV